VHLSPPLFVAGDSTNHRHQVFQAWFLSCLIRSQVLAGLALGTICFSRALLL
jgi:hypothetical protein